MPMAFVLSTIDVIGPDFDSIRIIKSTFNKQFSSNTYEHFVWMQIDENEPVKLAQNDNFFAREFRPGSRHDTSIKFHQTHNRVELINSNNNNHKYIYTFMMYAIANVGHCIQENSLSIEFYILQLILILSACIYGRAVVAV